MELRDKLLKDLQQAMRDKDAQRRSTLRLVRAAVANAEIETGRPLSDEEVLEIINKEASRRREAIQEYGQAGRQDLVEQEQAELSIIEGYLPRQLSQEEIEAAAREAIAKLGVGSPSQMGEVMRYLMPQLKGRADGRLVNQMVRELLSEDQ